MISRVQDSYGYEAMDMDIHMDIHVDIHMDFGYHGYPQGYPQEYPRLFLDILLDIQSSFWIFNLNSGYPNPYSFQIYGYPLWISNVIQTDYGYSFGYPVFSFGYSI